VSTSRTKTRTARPVQKPSADWLFQPGQLEVGLYSSLPRIRESSGGVATGAGREGAADWRKIHLGKGWRIDAARPRPAAKHAPAHGSDVNEGERWLLEHKAGHERPTFRAMSPYGTLSGPRRPDGPLHPRLYNTSKSNVKLAVFPFIGSDLPAEVASILHDVFSGVVEEGKTYPQVRRQPRPPNCARTSCRNWCHRRRTSHPTF
jgi:hypothetical protein